MKTKIILSMAIIVILPFGAQANISAYYQEQMVNSPSKVERYGTAKVAYGGPYETAEMLPGDATTVVSASYVKGAYNDTIAAINNLAFNKQDVLLVYDAQKDDYVEIEGSVALTLDYVSNEQQLITGYGVQVAIDEVNDTIQSKRVTAVDTWGSTHTVDLGLKTVTQ